MLKQGLHQKLLQKLSPQQIQLMKLLQVPTAQLEQRIKEELEINPALEEGDDMGNDDIESNAEDPEFENENYKEDAEVDGDNSIEDKTKYEEDFETTTTAGSDDDFDISDYLQDLDSADYKYSNNNGSEDDDQTEMPITVGASFHDNLLAQLGLSDLDDRHYRIAEYVIGSIDDDGYLRRELSAMVNDLMFSQNVVTDENELQQLLKLIQSFDPPGVGARTLQECLLLQLKRKDETSKDLKNAIIVVEKYMEEFSKKHYDKIAARLNLNDEDLKNIMHVIIKLNPRPGNTYNDGTKSIQHVVPDFLVYNTDGALELLLNSKNAPELRLSRSYLEMLDTYSKEKKDNKPKKDALVFVKQKIDSAKWFIDAIKQRQNTLLATMSAIMDYQYEFFLTGDEKDLRPMILKDIADIVGLDISTVSRVANSKYVQTQFGTFLLKRLFSEALSTDSGEEVSSREVKQILLENIQGEDKKHPLPDDKLTQILVDKGYNIARRTVAKYREQLGLPVARLRKEL